MDETRLYALEQGLRERHAEHPYGSAYQQVLLALALKRASEARTRIEAAAALGDPELEIHAANALAALSLGMRVEPSMMPRSQPRAEPRQQSGSRSDLCCRERYGTHVKTAAARQFLFDSNGDRTQHTDQALKRIGANEAAASSIASSQRSAARYRQRGARRDLLAQKFDGAGAC